MPGIDSTDIYTVKSLKNGLVKTGYRQIVDGRRVEITKEEFNKINA